MVEEDKNKPNIPDEESEIESILSNPESWQKADEMVKVYMLAQGISWDGSPYWAYMAVPPSLVMDFRIALTQQQNDIINYGDILAFGYGENPPQETQKLMEKTYNINHGFEDEVLKEVMKIMVTGDEKARLKEKYSSNLSKVNELLKKKPLKPQGEE